MPIITIARGGGWSDRFRSYAVHVDGTLQAYLAAKRSIGVEVPAGPHEVQLSIGLVHSSRPLRVDVGEAGVRLACGPNVNPGLALLSLARLDDWIWLRPDGA